MNIQSWFPLGLTGLILQSKGLSRVFSSTMIQKHLWCSAFFMVQLSHTYMTTGKIIALTIKAIVIKVTSLLFNTLSRFIIAFLPGNKHLLISWLRSPSTGILEPKKIKSFTLSTFSLSICHKVMGPLLLISCFESGIIYISEAADISPGNLDWNLWYIQSSISHYLLYIEVKLAKWQYSREWRGG